MRTPRLAAISIVILLSYLSDLSPGRTPRRGEEAKSPFARSPGIAAQTPKQPKVTPGPDEPDWEVILRERYGLSMFADLSNPVRTTPEATAGLFRKAGNGPV